MILHDLHVHNLRNLLPLRVQLHPHINLISGLNGSGKTSFLEAIYLLGNGHSFRSREIASLVTYNQPELSVFTKTADEQTISISKSLSAPTLVKINGTPCFTSSQLAYLLPTQVFYQDLFLIIDSGPAARRSVLDWGLFHVEHRYHTVWKNYRRALKQRNSLLKQRASAQHMAPWNKIMSDLADDLHAMRQGYMIHLNEKFQTILQSLSDIPCHLTYYKGWDKRQEGKSLELILQDTIETDWQRQYTHFGSHQADMLLVIDEHKARSHLSRGQQKIVLFALKFAQAELLSNHCIYLIDDIHAELDANHLAKIMDYIYHHDAQYVITTTTPQLLADYVPSHDYHPWHIDRGQIR